VLRRLFERLRGVLQLDDPPWRIALALAVGVFISCTPTFGVQTLLALVIATVARLNRVATVTGVWINLPWVSPFVYAGALQVGRAILPDQTGFSGFWLMLSVGTTLIGAVAGAVTYVAAYGALSLRRRKRAAVDNAGDVPTGGVDNGADVPRDREPAA
jgi:uncharacterized protein (DUF2062 family)